MHISFAEMLRRTRIEKDISQQQLAGMIHVDRSTLSGWETGRRLPDAAMISLLSQALGVNVADFLRAAEKPADTLNVIMIDDERIILDGEMETLQEILPGADINGFTNPEKAKEFLKRNKVQLAFLDIELGQISGFDVCRELLEIEPLLHVFYLTAFPQYALDAWKSGAFARLRWPIGSLGGV